VGDGATMGLVALEVPTGSATLGDGLGTRCRPRSGHGLGFPGGRATVAPRGAP
jgi:hypothetical protein